MMEFTASVNSWLAADPNNIIVVHCKGLNVILINCMRKIVTNCCNYFLKEAKEEREQWFVYCLLRPGFLQQPRTA